MRASPWPMRQLGDLIDLFDYKRVPVNSRDRATRKGPYPYYGASGIVDYVDSYIFEGRHILIAEDGENLRSRKTPISFFADGKFWVNNHAHIAKAKPGIADDYYVMIVLEHADISGFITGAAQPKLNQQNLNLIEIPCPPLMDQRRIADVLSAYDDLIENNTKRIKILEEMARSLYREWFVEFRFPGHNGVKSIKAATLQVPDGWRAETLGDWALNFDSKRRPLSGAQRAEMKGDYPYYGAAKIIDRVNAYLFDGRYLLVAEDGSVITADRRPVLQIASGRFWVNNHTHILQGKAPVSTDLLYLRLKELDVSPYITGAAQPKITQANLNRIPLLVPPPQLLGDFDKLVGPLLTLTETLQSKNDTLVATRDLLLPRLLSGEIELRP